MNTPHTAVPALARHRRSLRALAGLTQDQLAQAAGLSRPTVVRAEQGLSVGEDTLRALAAALRVSVADYVEPPAAVAAGVR